MNDYEPVDLSDWCNAKAEILGPEAGVKSGLQQFRGLPFLLGKTGSGVDSNCLIVPTGSLKIPVEKTAHRVIFAHRMLETQVPHGGPLGITVAEYLFHFKGGRTKRIPIRERFEIGTARFPTILDWKPGMAYLATPAERLELFPRKGGSWDIAGYRQMENDYRSVVSSFYLWAWVNPDPETVIEAIEIVPAGTSFVIGGITLSHLDEHPFARQGRRPIRIILTDPADARKPFDLDVEVDRGYGTYVFPLPEANDSKFLEDPHAGWGEPQNLQSSPAYVEVSAVPSALVSVKQSGKLIGQAGWGEVQQKGVVESSGVRFELADPGKNWVNIRVVDNETGENVPCRVHFRSPDGIPYQPHGHHNHVNANKDTWHVDVGGDLRLGQITYAYIDGTCQGWLPRGDVTVDIARGFEYVPVRKKVTIKPGQQELTIPIKRWINMAEQGWYSGDTHVHFLSERGSHTEARGEDLNVVNVLQAQWGSLFTNTEEFTGKPSISREGDTIVYVSSENRQHFLGHLTLLGLKRPVMPWSSDGPGEGEYGGTMETTLSRWADEAHAQGGYVLGTHFPQPNGEQAVLVATGRLDAIEMITMGKDSHDEYYRYLNCGYKLPLVGGTDKMSSEVPVGLYRTYARLGGDGELTYDNWCESVKQGRTFLSAGPIIHLSVDGKEVGDIIRMSGPGTVEIEAWAESNLPINTLQIVQAGKVVASTESRHGTRRLHLKERIRVDGHTWLAARTGGPGYFDGLVYHDIWSRGMFAHTSPIYIACKEDWWMFDHKHAEYMMTLIEGGLGYIRERSGQHSHGNVTHQHGQSDHMAYLEAPFWEAHKMVADRLKQSF